MKTPFKYTSGTHKWLVYRAVFAPVMAALAGMNVILFALDFRSLNPTEITVFLLIIFLLTGIVVYTVREQLNARPEQAH